MGRERTLKGLLHSALAVGKGVAWESHPGTGINCPLCQASPEHKAVFPGMTMMQRIAFLKAEGAWEKEGSEK